MSCINYGETPRGLMIIPKTCKTNQTAKTRLTRPYMVEILSGEIIQSQSIFHNALQSRELPLRAASAFFLFERKGFGRGGEFSSFSNELGLHFCVGKNLESFS